MSEFAKQPSFDFEYWSKLAKDDPKGFEVRRAALIEAAIQRAPEQSRVRLRRLQWKLDTIRATSRTPLAACVRMQELMWQGFVGGGGLCEALNAFRSDSPAGSPVSLPEAAVLLFDPKRSRES
jgi:hypothetical protein